MGALSEWGGFVKLWGKILLVMDRLMNSGQGDTLVRTLLSSPSLEFVRKGCANKSRVQEEAVAENMKNILLVMSSQGILVPPSEKPEHEALWNETWKRLDRFLPHLFAEIFPEEAKKPKGGTIRKSQESTPSSAQIPQRQSTPVQVKPENVGKPEEQKENSSEKKAEV
jgi:brefeldin A-resistance guanine nucleotide exchange factor 1